MVLKLLCMRNALRRLPGKVGQVSWDVERTEDSHVHERKEQLVQLKSNITNLCLFRVDSESANKFPERTAKDSHYGSNTCFITLAAARLTFHYTFESICKKTNAPSSNEKVIINDSCSYPGGNMHFVPQKSIKSYVEFRTLKWILHFHVNLFAARSDSLFTSNSLFAFVFH